MPALPIVEARAFVAGVPWRHVKMAPVGEGLADGGVERWGEHRHVLPDPHEYVILGWRQVDRDQFERFVDLIRAKGYKGTYVAPYRPDSVSHSRFATCLTQSRPQP